jgi:hypothetical protein
MQGSLYVDHSNHAPYEATELVALDFNMPVDPAEIKAALSIAPTEPVDLRALDLGRRITIRFRKVPGATYRLQLAAGVHGLEGGQSTDPYALTVVTSDPRIPAPLRATPDEPYRYGVLAHPYPWSLNGANADAIVTAMADAGVRFVRIDYCGASIEPQEGHFVWETEDRIASELAAHGITELPIIDQYCAPAWGTGGGAYPSIWSKPLAYATFAGAVAAHVAQTFPRIKRIELFNEPNLRGWWDNTGDPGYAATDGSATAEYMRSAYDTIKRADPGIIVVGPALASGGHEVDPRTFFDTLYTNGCRRGVCWDVISVHNYRWENPTFPAPASASSRFDIYKALQDIAAKHGDSNTHVMITEWGYSTDPASFDGVAPQTQARYVALGLNEMLADPLVDGIVYVNMYDPEAGFWGGTALLNNDFQPKPAYWVFRSFAR